MAEAIITHSAQQNYPAQGRRGRKQLEIIRLGNVVPTHSAFISPQTSQLCKFYYECVQRAQTEWGPALCKHPQHRAGSAGEEMRMHGCSRAADPMKPSFSLSEESLLSFKVPFKCNLKGCCFAGDACMRAATPAPFHCLLGHVCTDIPLSLSSPLLLRHLWKGHLQLTHDTSFLLNSLLKKIYFPSNEDL